MITIRRTGGELTSAGPSSTQALRSPVPITSAIIYFLAILMLIPLMVGGLIAIPFQLIGLQQRLATLLGLLVGALVAFVVMYRDRSALLADVGYGIADKHDVEPPSVNNISIQNITKTWIVLELEDFGPGYVVETLEKELVYFAGQSLIDDDGNKCYPTAHMVVYVDCNTSDLIDVQFIGAAVPVVGEVWVSRLPFEASIGFCFLSQPEFEKAISDY